MHTPPHSFPCWMHASSLLLGPSLFWTTSGTALSSRPLTSSAESCWPPETEVWLTPSAVTIFSPLSSQVMSASIWGDIVKCPAALNTSWYFTVLSKHLMHVSVHQSALMQYVIRIHCLLLCCISRFLCVLFFTFIRGVFSVRCCVVCRPAVWSGRRKRSGGGQGPGDAGALCEHETAETAWTGPQHRQGVQGWVQAHEHALWLTNMPSGSRTCPLWWCYTQALGGVQPLELGLND